MSHLQYFSCLVLLFYTFRRLSVFPGGDRGDNEYTNRSEGDIDMEHDHIVKHIYQITAEIAAEKGKTANVRERLWRDEGPSNLCEDSKDETVDRSSYEGLFEGLQIK